MPRAKSSARCWNDKSGARRVKVYLSLSLSSYLRGRRIVDAARDGKASIVSGTRFFFVRDGDDDGCCGEWSEMVGVNGSNGCL